MPLAILTKRLDEAIEADLQELVDLQVDERHTIEYKRDLPGLGHADRVEFLADISNRFD